ncbi:MAG TPA: redoxin domain-containing protein [Ilumatobacteraceae bacterium]|nr:redoxin domain-containing protein [Ilumatobacteraceae bacterium]
MHSTFLRVGDQFPDAELLDHEGRPRSISSFLTPSRIDPYLGFNEGYPAIIVFIRGPFCPRDQSQLRALVGAQHELGLNGCSIVTVSVQPPEVLAAFRFGLGATWSFLSDQSRDLIGALDLIDETEGEEAFVSRPMTFVLDEGCAVRSVYDGWWSIGRPSPEELRRDIRAIMSSTPRFPYDAWTTPRATQVRVPQQTWLGDHEALPDPEHAGRVAWFDPARGIGVITPDRSDAGIDDDIEDAVFFSFTAIPGSGYRTVRPGHRVMFDLADNPIGPVATRLVVVG